MLRREFLFDSLAGAAATFTSAAVAADQRDAALERINIVSTSATTNLVLTALLTQIGYLRQFGIAPNFINVADGNKVVAALISGDVDICPLAGFTQVLAAIAKGAPLKMIGGGANKNFNA